MKALYKDGSVARKVDFQFINLFGTENVGWKQDWIRGRPDAPRHIFGQAEELRFEFAYCITLEKYVRVPSADWIDLGFVGNNLSMQFVARSYCLKLATGQVMTSRLRCEIAI